jgi:hypothetical protein
MIFLYKISGNPFFMSQSRPYGFYAASLKDMTEPKGISLTVGASGSQRWYCNKYSV